MVSLIYWSVLFPLRVIYEGFKTDFNDISVHALNVVLILIEQYLGAVPSRLTHVVHPLVYGLTYTLFSLIPYYTMDLVLYPFILDWSNPGLTVISILGIILYCCVAQLVLFLIYREKNKCAKKWSSLSQYAIIFTVNRMNLFFFNFYICVDYPALIAHSHSGSLYSWPINEMSTHSLALPTYFPEHWRICKIWRSKDNITSNLSFCTPDIWCSRL